MNNTALKMHGAGNTFALVDERPPRVRSYAALARTLCAPQSRIGGADGLLVLHDAAGCAAAMSIYNADGSAAEMCGNGLRCAARYLSERGAGDAFTIATPGRNVPVTIVRREPFSVRVDLGDVSFPGGDAPQSIAFAGREQPFYRVSVGNPHAVAFVDDVAAVDLPALARAFADDARFPDGTNVHVAQQLDASTLLVRHYERGAGMTRACGTGAVACAATAIGFLGARSAVVVRVPGGVLEVDWNPGETAGLTGPAETMPAHALSA